MARTCLWVLAVAIVAAFVLTCSSGWFLGWYQMVPTCLGG